LTTFQTELQSQGAAALAAAPAIKHSWVERPGLVALTFPSTSLTGFQVTVEASDAGITLSAGRMHVPFDGQEGPAALVSQALGLARDLLSPSMRLREHRLLGLPYRWYLEHAVGEVWQVEHEMGLLAWFPSAFSTRAFYQNSQLPVR